MVFNEGMCHIVLIIICRYLCGFTQVVTVEYKSLERTRLSGALQEATGCVFCDPVLTPLVEKKVALKPRIIRNRPSRPAGAKGKPKKKPKPKDKMAQLAAYFV